MILMVIIMSTNHGCLLPLLLSNEPVITTHNIKGLLKLQCNASFTIPKNILSHTARQIKYHTQSIVWLESKSQVSFNTKNRPELNTRLLRASGFTSLT